MKWETTLSSPGLKSCEATISPCLHLHSVHRELGSVQVIPTLLRKSDITCFSRTGKATLHTCALKLVSLLASHKISLLGLWLLPTSSGLRQPRSAVAFGTPQLQTKKISN